MDSSLRISNYSFSLFPDRTGISVNVTLSDGSTGKVQRCVNRFNVMSPGHKLLTRIGFTHPDFTLIKNLYVQRNLKLREYREAVNHGKGKAFIL